MNGRSQSRSAGRRSGAIAAWRGTSLSLLAVGFVFLLVNGPGSRSLAQSGSIHPLAAPGLTLRVDTNWLDGAGYRPIRLTVTPGAPVIADRTLAFEFTTMEYYGGSPSRIRVAQDIEIPAGSGPVTATILVPYSSGHNNYEFEFGEDGRAILGTKGSGSFQNLAYEERFPRVLAVGQLAPNTANLGRVFFGAGQMGYGGTAYGYPGPNSSSPSPSPSATAYPLPTLQTLALGDLTDRWLDYSALDLVAISRADLIRLKRLKPAALEAILAWTAAGGNLLVFGLGDWDRLKDLETLAGLPPGQAPRDGAPPDEWGFPNRSQWGRPLRGIGDDVLGPFDPLPETPQQNWSPYAGMPMPADAGPSQPKPKPESENVDRTPPASPPFATRALEMGKVVAVVSEKPFDERPVFWAWVFNDLSSERGLWYQRHGFSAHYDNPDFYKFLIQGVGQPPLNAFRVLITLFVVGIGPVNYFALRRWRRLHLLVVTVPASAALVTVALFAYAFVTDGLGTRVRARSVTRINQSTGRTECWSRLSYYSGMAPGRGLRFSGETAVYPLRAVPGERTITQRELVWVDDQRMTSGWLRSRTPTQFLTVRSRKTGLKLDVGAAVAGGLPVRNGLAAEVQQVLIRADDGSFYWAENLRPDEKATAGRVDLPLAMAQIRAAIRACEMAYPPGMGDPSVPYRSRRRWYSTNFPTAGPTQKTSLLEQAISQAERSDSAETFLARRSYLAVVALGPEVELGTPLAEPEASLHLVYGTW